METEKRSAVLITGGCGFVGRSLGQLLQRHGYPVISVDVAPPGTRSNDTSRDITDVSQLCAVFQRSRIDAIVHLAAILPTVAQREPLRATRVNVQGSLHLLEMARQFGVQRFIFGSSLSVYGTCPGDQTVSERDPAAPEDLYGAAKLYVEQLGEAYRETCGTEFVSLRIGRVVGPGARSTTSAWRSEIFESLHAADAKIEIPYAESERVLLVHVDGVARMLFELLRAEHLRHTVYNAGCESVIVGELKSIVQRLNPRLQVNLAEESVVGNPRRVDWSRFAAEFGFKMVPIFEQLAKSASEQKAES
ncbi:MAG TPA: NAD(P)-dependent oxidoreductase [Candidatus Sulfotelmatobacter sp.]|nr:NAD(P)-dependent oxidoreductase [Candidatus Sulfotelmatobacter sp.]